MMTDYVPIACDSHAELELFALRRRWLGVRALDPSGQPQHFRGRLLDLVTRDGAEYAVVQEAGSDHVDIRLDHLLGLYDDDGNCIWRQEIGESCGR